MSSTNSVPHISQALIVDGTDSNSSVMYANTTISSVDLTVAAYDDIQLGTGKNSIVFWLHQVSGNDANINAEGARDGAVLLAAIPPRITKGFSLNVRRDFGDGINVSETGKTGWAISVQCQKNDKTFLYDSTIKVYGTLTITGPYV
tara:strand:- start:418 stop:855 length:438 start_codon:yes stop_codon:yes gene_type:complete